MNALIVIDMQPHFDYKNVFNKIMVACQEEICKAIQEDITIVFLEYIDCGSTDIRLKQLVKNYNNVLVVIKEDNDGSQEIVAELGRNYNTFRVCGVYTNECVFATVEGLIDLCPYLKVEVVAAAVNSYASDDKTYCFKKLPRTTVV